MIQADPSGRVGRQDVPRPARGDRRAERAARARPHSSAAVHSAASDADHFLCDGVGFDKYADLTTEYQVKGEFADTASGSTASSPPCQHELRHSAPMDH